MQLTRKYKDAYHYISTLFDIEKCRICNNEYCKFDVNIYIDDKNYVTIKEIFYPKNMHCYSKNKNCDVKKLNPNSVEFVSKVHKLNETQALEFIHLNNKSPFYKENHLNEKSYSKFQSRNISYFIKVYGEEDGKIKYNKMIETQKYKRSKKFFVEKYGEVNGTLLYEKISKSKDNMSFDYFLKKYNDEKIAYEEYLKRKTTIKTTIDKFIKKYGENGITMYNTLCEKRKITSSKKYYVEKYGVEKWNERIKNSVMSKENFIKKYGQDGLRKYQEYRSKLNVNMLKASKESLNIFLPLLHWINENKIDDKIYVGYQNMNEYFINTTDHFYSYDFTLLNQMIIIEYHNEIWHPNKNMQIDEWNNWKNPFNKNITADDAYNKQLNKNNTAILKGFKLLEIWSSSSIEENIKICKKFIMSNI